MKYAALVILWLMMRPPWPLRVRFACAHARDIIKHNGPINVSLPEHGIKATV